MLLTRNSGCKVTYFILYTTFIRIPLFVYLCYINKCSLFYMNSLLFFLSLHNGLR